MTVQAPLLSTAAASRDGIGRASKGHQLVVGSRNDPLEGEAERVAAEAMADPRGSSPPAIQRQAGAATAGPSTAPASVDRALAAVSQPLEAGLRRDMERRFGHDFARVRVHAGGAAEESARDVGAAAYTVGHHVVFGANQFPPRSERGRRLLAHELAHVVQQSPSHSPGAHVPAPLVQRGPDDTTPPPKDAETMLGERLRADFPNGVRVGFYDSGLAEAERRAKDWATENNALGLKGSKISADEVVFGKPIPDTLKVSGTLVALGKVLEAAVTKAAPAAGTGAASAAGAAKVAVLGIFSHGTSDWCGIGGGLTSSNAAAVVKAIAPVVAPDLKVLLYSCSGARGPDEEEQWVKGTLEGGGAGSVASKVRDALVEEGISEGEVWGHTTVGHVTENFALRFFTAASGKGQEGFAYAGFYVWGTSERVSLLFQLQRLVEDKGYVVDDKSSKKFFGKASNGTNQLMYSCYAKANKELTYNGQNLATAAPLHPREVAALIKEYWETNYWTEDKKMKLADKLVKDAKLKKASDTK